MIIDFINGAHSERMFGYKRFQDELHKNLNNIKLNIIEYKPSKNIIIQIFNFLFLYPLIVLKNIRKNNIKHITSQDLTYLIPFIRLKKCVVSCYDLISYHRIKDFRFFNRILININYRNLKNADKIITLSEYSKKDIIRTLNIPQNKISVINPCVDKKNFYPNHDRKILKKWGISSEKVILYVGSEEPRQNVDKIILALKILVKKYPDIVFLKVGNPQWVGGREKLIDLVKRLKLEKNVIFTNYVDESDLPKYYNAADVFVYPCDHAGWGLPPMEALACKIPVVVSKTTSIPEAVGEGGLYVLPHDYKSIAKKIEILFENKKLREEKIKSGFLHVKKFSWKNESKKLEKLYKTMNNDISK